MAQPAIKFRDGVLQVVVWRNSGERGAYYTVNIQRSFKRENDSWGETDSLGQDDLLAMAELFREAYAWIKRQKQADAKARRDEATA